MSNPTTITVNASAWARVTRERDEARDMVHGLRKQRAIARKFGEQMERERDEAREAFAIATNNCVDAQQRLREMERELNEAREALKQ
jgi:uncharacterized protein involved in exopolysaccharide biosynthesis